MGFGGFGVGVEGTYGNLDDGIALNDAIGHPVVRLIRTRIGPLADRSLAPGAWRELTGDELRSLQRAVAVPEARSGG